MAALVADDGIFDILTSIGLQNLINGFRTKRFDILLVLAASDMELSRLGVITLGDKIRLRDCCRMKQQQQARKCNLLSPDDINKNENGAFSPALNLGRFEARVSERDRLFRGRRLRGNKDAGHKPEKEKRRTWTVNFMCLANIYATQIPTTEQKITLQKAGLGFKKVKLEINDNEDNVYKKIVEVFPQVKESGGIELMACLANSRDLVLLNCSLAAKEIKLSMGGGQGKVYIRPIQRSLSTKAINEEILVTLKDKCLSCGKEFLLNELRSHKQICFNVSSDENDDIFELPVFSPFKDNDSFNSSNNSFTQANIFSMQPLPQYELPQYEPPNVNFFLSSLESKKDNMNENDLSSSLNSDKNDGYNFEGDLDAKIAEIILYCNEKSILQNPVEILRYMQKKLISGRALEITDLAVCPEGETSFILIDRLNVLTTAFEELLSIKNKLITLEVQFYSEDAKDFGGPRKEFFEIILRKIREKYFDNGILDSFPEDYYAVGLVFGFSILQNGKLPKFLCKDALDEIFYAIEPKACYNEMRSAFKEFGIYQIACSLPIILQLFHSSDAEKLTFKRLSTLLKPSFAECGSNDYVFQSKIYAMFNKYLREAASGRRKGVTLEKVLQFVTGAETEPVLGYELHPSISFISAENGWIPTSNTCSSVLNLPRPSIENKILSEENLFRLYDYAFNNTFFGML